MACMTLQFICFLLTIVLSLKRVVHCAGGSSNEENRESLDFVFPDHEDPIGRQCINYSRWFCLMGYWLNYKQSDRSPVDSDQFIFEQLVRYTFDDVNWFSFKPQDASNGGCCSYQTSMYVDYGQKFGLSPVAYYNKIFSYTAQERAQELVFLKSRWSDTMCRNVISQVGFGKGKLRIVGSKRMTKQFVVPPLGGSTKVFVFGGSKVTTELDFPWLMYHVVCPAKPELCPNMQPAVGTSHEPDFSRFGRPRKLLMFDFEELSKNGKLTSNYTV